MGVRSQVFFGLVVRPRQLRRPAPRPDLATTGFEPYALLAAFSAIAANRSKLFKMGAKFCGRAFGMGGIVHL
jgi:hypothetical protein